MIDWPVSIRVNRIVEATNELTRGGGRWQSAIRLDPESFERAQGVRTGQDIIRAGVEPALVACLKTFHEAVGGYAASRALPYLPEPFKERVTLHPWTENVQIPPARWGGKLRAAVPDDDVAAPVDDQLWEALRSDALRGQDSWRTLENLFGSLNGKSEPEDALLAEVLMKLAEPRLPETWAEPAMGSIAVLIRETEAGAWRHFLGGDARAVVIAEAVTLHAAPPLNLPTALATKVEEEQRGWKDRATPPAKALELWQEWTAELSDDLLDWAWNQSLRDETAAALIKALRRNDTAVEPENASLWSQQRAFTPGGPWMETLQKLDAEAHTRLTKRHKDESGRFKGKVRKQAGAAFMAKLSLLYAFDEWCKTLLNESLKRVEIVEDDPARLEEEAARKSLYGYTLSGPVSGESQVVGVEAEAEQGASETVYRTGHLFADMKGFTRLTAELKEAETRHFLKENFYGPFLRLAKEYFKGGIDLADRGGIRLNNLLGDAISLCGSVRDLLDFSERSSALVQDHLRELVRRNSAAHAAKLELAERQELEQRLSELKVQKAKGEGDLEAVEAEIAELNESLRGSGEAVHSPDLDFGTFIAFGAAPIDLKFDDDVFGEVQVALAEKINESARGTERSEAVLTSLQAFARANNRPDGPWAFRVHVGPAISGDLPEILLDAWPTTPEEVDTVARSLGNQIPFQGTTSLYNAGTALSDEAVEDVLDAVNKGVHTWRGKTEELGDLSDRFLMAEPMQAFLLLAWSGDKPRILRKVGRVYMKGVTQPPLIWEWVRPGMEIYPALVAFLRQQGTQATWQDGLDAIRA